MKLEDKIYYTFIYESALKPECYEKFREIRDKELEFMGKIPKELLEEYKRVSFDIQEYYIDLLKAICKHSARFLKQKSH